MKVQRGCSGGIAMGRSWNYPSSPFVSFLCQRTMWAADERIDCTHSLKLTSWLIYNQNHLRLWKGHWVFFLTQRTWIMASTIDYLSPSVPKAHWMQEKHLWLIKTGSPSPPLLQAQTLNWKFPWLWWSLTLLQRVYPRPPAPGKWPMAIAREPTWTRSSPQSNSSLSRHFSVVLRTGTVSKRQRSCWRLSTHIMWPASPQCIYFKLSETGVSCAGIQA